MNERGGRTADPRDWKDVGPDADSVIAPEGRNDRVALEGDFTVQQLNTDAITAVEDAEPYSPPTDPVIDVDDRAQVHVLGGFSPSATDGMDAPPSAEDGRPGDAALEDAVRDELRRDAATTDMVVGVRVREGVAYLSGSAASLDDAENAEAVAARVPGVIEVVEEFTVQGM